MNDTDSSCCLLEEPGAVVEESTGLSGENEEAECVEAPDLRPLSMAWISEELLAKTIDVWSANYGRPISEDEAVEILMNVKRLAEVLVDARKEMDSR
ncbi:MAG: hypothetical protein WD468_11760 [Pirellulales bacterium]